MDPSTAHSDGISWYMISAAIEPQVVSVAWEMAQLGWIGGLFMVGLFSLGCYCTATLFTRWWYAHGDGSNNLFISYPRAVGAGLGGGGMQAKMCGLFQFIYLLGLSIGHTDAASISMMNLMGMPEIMCSEGNSCDTVPQTMLYLILFGVAQIILSHIPYLNRKSRLSKVGFVMTLIYSVIAVGVAIAKIAENHTIGGSLTGIPIGAALTPYDKIWSTLKALGDIAFAFGYTMIFIEIQGTRNPPPSEESSMKKALIINALATTFLYLLHCVFGYAAYGDSAPRNVLSESFNPVWILKIANAAVLIHLIILYQANCRPLFEFVEKWAAERFPDLSKTLFRRVWRTVFVIITTGITILLPADNIGGLLVAIGFWPLMVYYPVAIYISQMNIPKWSREWWALQTLCLACFVIAVAAAAGNVAGFIFIPHLKSA